MPELSPEKKQAIVAELAGTSGVYDSGVAQEHGIDVSDLDAIMEEAEHVRCSCCDWWVELHETLHDESESEEHVCSDCRG